MNCRFCQGYLKSGGSQTGPYPYTKLIYHCESCHSQQQYKYDATPLDFSFWVRFTDYYHYYLSFDPMTMKLYIAKVHSGSSLEWKTCLDIHLSEFPAWLRPDNITEERIQTLMVFS